MPDVRISVPHCSLRHAGGLRTETGGPVVIPIPEGTVAFIIQAVSRGAAAWATQTVTIGRTVDPSAPAVAHSPAVELTPAAPASGLVIRQGSYLVPSIAAAEADVALDLHVQFLSGALVT